MPEWVVETGLDLPSGFRVSSRLKKNGRRQYKLAWPYSIGELFFDNLIALKSYVDRVLEEITRKLARAFELDQIRRDGEGEVEADSEISEQDADDPWSDESIVFTRYHSSSDTFFEVNFSTGKDVQAASIEETLEKAGLGSLLKYLEDSFALADEFDLGCDVAYAPEETKPFRFRLLNGRWSRPYADIARLSLAVEGQALDSTVPTNAW